VKPFSYLLKNYLSDFLKTLPYSSSATSFQFQELSEEKNKMGNILDELKEIIAIPCDECNGVGFVFWGNENNYDVETCDCQFDETELI
jgi:hypothetical protein